MKKLFNFPKRKISAQEKEILFEQYKLYLQSIENISERRTSANNYFLSVNAAILTAIGLSFELNGIEDFSWIRAGIPAFGCVLSIIFYFLINSYKQLNSGKFKVLHEIENELPLNLYDYEWTLLGRGKNKRKYFPFSHIEKWIPIMFGLLYVLLTILFIIVET